MKQAENHIEEEPMIYCNSHWESTFFLRISDKTIIHEEIGRYYRLTII